VIEDKYKPIILSAVVGLSFWVVQAALDALVFAEGSFLDLLIFDVPGHELYSRLVVLAISIVSGVLISRFLAERRRAEEALRRTEQEKAAILGAMSELVAYQDTEMRVLWANRAAGESVGLAPERLVGSLCYEVWHQRSSPCADCPVEKARETGRPQEGEITSPDGRVWSIRGYPVRDANGDVVGSVEVTLDISERRRAEEEREKIQAQLLQSQKMEAIGRLAGGVAHDFNNLLTTITGYSGLLLNSLDDGDPLRGDLEEIMKATRRAASLTRQLLAFSRKQVLQPQSLDLNALVSDVGKMLHRIIGEDIELVNDLEPRLGRVKADPGQIEQIIMNLVVNARDAMPQGGRLTIKTENVILDEDYCQVFAEARPGEFVRLSVEDTGVGMDKKTLQHMFEPFFSTKEDGTGLGLSVVYGIVKQHEGWVNVYSEPGQGSAFKVYLPAFAVEAEGKKVEAISLQELQGSGERILLVEDDEGVRKLTTRALGRNGYVVFEAARTQEALRVFEGEGGKFHLVFTDVVLPDGTGLQLIDQLLPRNPELRVLLSSGYTDRKSQWPLIRARGFRFLQKPYALAELLRAIREAIKPGEVT
jgi:two-component system cell cycle sensor histidine kinase/response regulator CckA